MKLENIIIQFTDDQWKLALRDAARQGMESERESILHRLNIVLNKSITNNSPSFVKGVKVAIDTVLGVDF